jgi:hypothetical protein
MYHRFAAPALKVGNVSGDKNGFLVDYLMAHIEELQNDNYRNHFFENLLKILTTKNSDCRKLYKDTVGAINIAIVGCNTNKDDLYGLIRLAVDSPEIQRVVLLNFINPLPVSVWDEFKLSIGLLDSKNTEEDRRNLGFTLYQYLKHEYKIAKDFNSCRYFGNDKYVLWKQLQSTNKSYIDRWLSRLRFENCTDDIDAAYKILQILRDRQRNEYVGFSAALKDINASYQCFRRESGDRVTSYEAETIIKILVEKGFKQVKTGGYPKIRIEKEEWEKLACFCDEEDEELEVVTDYDLQPTKALLTELDVDAFFEKHITKWDGKTWPVEDAWKLFCTEKYKCSLGDFKGFASTIMN